MHFEDGRKTAECLNEQTADGDELTKQFWIAKLLLQWVDRQIDILPFVLSALDEFSACAIIRWMQ